VLDANRPRAYSAVIVTRRIDPLANAPELIRRVYAYVAYRIGDGPDAEDVTGDVFERALRYRQSYDPSRGEPLSWLFGIARRCIEDARARPDLVGTQKTDPASPEDLEAAAVERLTLTAALVGLDERAQDLLALRYGADLTAKQIGQVLDLKTNAVEVALHRALAKLRAELEAGVAESGSHRSLRPSPSPSAAPGQK
jgi:RNA polymerase sigma-70 factor (ECF subfamily)